MWTNRLWDQMDRLLGPIAANALPSTAVPSVYPALNLWEDDDNLFVEAELPGMSQDQIEITVAEGDQLTIAGERRPPTGEGSVWHRQESGYGRFSRTVTLPVVVDAGRVEAKIDSGVLTLILPKSEMAKPKRIPVTRVDSNKALSAN